MTSPCSQATGRPAVRVERSTIGGGPAIPVVSLIAAASGPRVAITANLHGDECTGIGVAHALIDLLPSLLERGMVDIYPSLNPGGLTAGTRGAPGDANDPNRSFPGSRRARGARRLAWRIWNDIRVRRPDLLVDIHTDAGGAIPYAIVDRVVRGEAADHLFARCIRLATASGLTVLREYPADRYLRFGLDHSLPGALVNGPGIPAVTLEVGPRRYLDPVAVEEATVALLGVLTEGGLVDRPAPMHPSRQGGGPWRRAGGPLATVDGVLCPRRLPGQTFEPGDAIAEIRDLDGTVREVLHARTRGFVVALLERTWVESGTACGTVAEPDL